jgi:hypothetical protein
LLWRGIQNGGKVYFQFATRDDPSTNIADWVFVGGSSCGSATFFEASENTAVLLNCLAAQNKRYIRYKIKLESNAARTLSPKVDDVILTWNR